jgi:antitoxin component YwqK of YwqJK toxin-antitoxin module
LYLTQINNLTPARRILIGWFVKESIMKRLLLIIPLVLFLVSCSEREVEWSELNERQGIYYAPLEDKPYSGKVITIHDGHPAAINGYVKNGRRDGLWRQWWSVSGQLSSEETYINGKRDGLSRLWYMNGSLQLVGAYVNGKKDGLFRQWWESSGQLFSEKTYVNGERDGLWRWWHDNGSLQLESTYVNGQVSGLRRSWYDNGQLSSEVTYVNGECVSGCE